MQPRRLVDSSLKHKEFKNLNFTWTFVFIAMGFGGFFFSGEVMAAEKPNVLFIICDDLNCDLGAYGHEQVRSPNIDRLAAEGITFNRAYCQYPLCGPSRASFMTGLYPDQTLIRGNKIYLRDRLPDVQSMSQMFINAGYEAARIGKIYHYGVPSTIGTDGTDDPASWTYKFNPIGRDKTEEDKVFSLVPGKYGAVLSWLAAEGTDEEQTDGIGATKAVELLNQYAEAKTPFFLAVGFYRPHTPFVAPKKYFEMYPRDEIVVPKVSEGYLETLPKPAQVSLTRKSEHNLEDDMARAAIQAYYASITFVDAQVGRVLDALKTTGLDKNTIVVFTSDHGYHMGEHGHYQKTTLFENADRVPLIISAPGMSNQGKQTDSFAEMIDFYPTLAALSGLEAPAYVSGVSLVPVFEDVTATPRTDALTVYNSGYGLRTDRYRYNEWGEDGVDGAELYDHQSDPQEMINLANDAEYTEIVARLSKRIRNRIAAACTAPVGIKQIPAPQEVSKPKKKNQKQGKSKSID